MELLVATLAGKVKLNVWLSAPDTSILKTASGIVELLLLLLSSLSSSLLQEVDKIPDKAIRSRIKVVFFIVFLFVIISINSKNFCLLDLI
jgi:hypothetical protein